MIFSLRSCFYSERISFKFRFQLPAHLRYDASFVDKRTKLFHFSDTQRRSICVPSGADSLSLIRYLLISSECRQANNFLNVVNFNLSSQPEVNFTVCFAPLNRNYDNQFQLIETVELNRMFGAQRFVIYNYSTGSHVTKNLIVTNMKESLTSFLGKFPWKWMRRKVRNQKFTITARFPRWTTVSSVICGDLASSS